MNDNDEKRFRALHFLYSTRNMPYVEHVERNNPYTIVNQFVGMNPSQARNVLQYLENKGFIKIEETDVAMLSQPEKVLATQLQTKKFYRITALGEDFIENWKKEESIFRAKSEDNQSMNITNIGGVTVVGNNNIVNAKFGEVYDKLEALKKEILSSSHLSHEEKIGCSSDIETIQSQLAKPSPSKEIIKVAWSAIEKGVVLANFGDKIHEIAKFISEIIT